MEQTDRQTDRQSDYSNTRCACPPRVNNFSIVKMFLCELEKALFMKNANCSESSTELSGLINYKSHRIKLLNVYRCLEKYTFVK